jgi:hypothetical protein
VRQLVTGVKALAAQPVAVAVILFCALDSAVYGAASVLYVPLSVRLGTGANGYSYLLAGTALGAVLGAALANRLSGAARLAPGLPALLGADRTSAAEAERLRPRVRLLSELELLAGADRRTLERLAAAAQEVVMPAGTVIIRQGDEADALWILASGELSVQTSGDGTGPHDLPPVTAPGYVGELGLLHRIPRTATVRTAQRSRCCGSRARTSCPRLRPACPAPRCWPSPVPGWRAPPTAPRPEPGRRP